MDRMIALMAAGCERVVDPSLVPPGIPATITGAGAVAQETRQFAARIQASAALLVDGRRAYVIAPGGHPLALIEVRTTGGLVSRVTIRRAPVSALSSTALRMPG